MQNKIKFLGELIRMMRVDDQHHEREFEFLKILAGMMGVKDEYLNHLFHQYARVTPPPISEKDRIVMFQLLVLMANVDHHVSAEEVHHLHEMGLHLGIRGKVVEAILEEMEAHEGGMIPADRLVEIVKVQQN